MREVVSLGGHRAPAVLVAVAQREAARFAAFRFDGIFGLGMIVEPFHTQVLWQQLHTAAQ
jgi:hypothetical protein